MHPRKRRTVLFAIVLAQFCGTSLWFAGNAILPQFQEIYEWPAKALAFITSATQLGFITGTLAFAITGLTDRFSPSRVFVASSIIAAASNLLMLADHGNYALAIVSRFLVGFFLAGIYPVGMKIASDWKAEGLGHWLGALVGALVLGTAFPHGLRLFPQFVDAGHLLIAMSLLSTAGTVVLAVAVPDGPYRKKVARFSFAAVKKSFQLPALRSPAIGYFGHMWELYAFWAFVPWIIERYREGNELTASTSLLAFLIIGAGSLSCIAGGYWSLRAGSSRVARCALAASGICCALSPLLWNLPSPLFICFMMVWGMAVVADSPQFSALIARNAPESLRGSAITLVTCIGFSITIVSIQLLSYLQEIVSPDFLLLLLVPGPALGLAAAYARPDGRKAPETESVKHKA